VIDEEGEGGAQQREKEEDCYANAITHAVSRSHRSRENSTTVLVTTPRNGNRLNGNHLDQSLSFSQKNGNSLTWVLVALTVCFAYPVLYRVSSESRAGEWEL